MTTLELFKKHRKGEVSRERFLYEVRRDNNLPWVTNTTSYDDAVKILKNKGIIREAQFEPQNITTDPAVDRANPYAVKREVQKLLAKEKELTNDSYKIALNKAAKKIAGNPQAIKDAMFANADTVAKADEKLQTKEVKKNNFVDKDNGMKKIKGQEALKAMSAPTKENKKGKPKGVKVMPDKGVEGSPKIIKEISEFIKKKLAENSTFHEYHVGMEVETPHGLGVIKEINGGTLTVECGDGMYDVQMNTVKHFMEKKIEQENEASLRGGLKPYHDPTSQLTGTGKPNVTGPMPTDDLDDETDLQIGDRVKVVYGNQFYGMTGTIEDVKGGFVIVNIDEDGEDYSMHSSDVEKIGEEEDDDQFYGEDDLAEAIDINDPALVNARAKLAPPSRTPVAAKEMDLEILRQIKALKIEKFRVMRDMEQEAEPEGGPIADDYADRIMDLDQQIKALKDQLYIHEDELEESGVEFKIPGASSPTYTSTTDAASKEAELRKANIRFTKKSVG